MDGSDNDAADTNDIFPPASGIDASEEPEIAPRTLAIFAFSFAATLASILGSTTGGVALLMTMMILLSQGYI